MNGKCSVRECEDEATRTFRDSRLCTIHYLERSAVDVRNVRITMSTDKHTRDMFGGNDA